MVTTVDVAVVVGTVVVVASVVVGVVVGTVVVVASGVVGVVRIVVVVAADVVVSWTVVANDNITNLSDTPFRFRFIAKN